MLQSTDTATIDKYVSDEYHLLAPSQTTIPISHVSVPRHDHKDVRISRITHYGRTIKYMSMPLSLIVPVYWLNRQQIRVLRVSVH